MKNFTGYTGRTGVSLIQIGKDARLGNIKFTIPNVGAVSEPPLQPTFFLTILFLSEHLIAKL